MFCKGELNISRKNLAHTLNVGFATINRWENTKTKAINVVRAVFNDFCDKHGISFNESEVE